MTASEPQARSKTARNARRAIGGAAVAGAVGAAGYAASRAVAGRKGVKGHQQVTELELPAGIADHRVQVSDGGVIHVVEAGSGPLVVLLHGAGLSSSVWAYQFHDLAATHRLVALDLRGHGESEPGSDGVTIARMADDLAEVLEHLELDGALLVGHSMGGMTVLRFARRHPGAMTERVASVLLMSTAAGVIPDVGLWTKLGPLAARTAVSLDALVNRSGRFGVPGGRVGAVAGRMGFGVRPSAEQVEATLAMLRATKPNRLVGLFPELMSFDERATYTDLEVPVTVLVGDRDRLTPPPLARQLAERLPGARLLVWAGAGHMLMYERREALDWLIGSLSRTAPVPSI